VLAFFSPPQPHRQAGDGHATVAGGDSGGMQPDAAVLELPGCHDRASYHGQVE
jgi:hypothetical protein